MEKISIMDSDRDPVDVNALVEKLFEDHLLTFDKASETILGQCGDGPHKAELGKKIESYRRELVVMTAAITAASVRPK